MKESTLAGAMTRNDVWKRVKSAVIIIHAQMTVKFVSFVLQMYWDAIASTLDLPLVVQ
jgi:hypothetical protein